MPGSASKIGNREDTESRSVYSNVRWSAIEQYGSQAIRFFSYIVLARLLVPQDFGLVAMAGVFSGFVNIFYRLGTGTVVVQQKNLSDNLLCSLFLLNVVTGTILAIILILLSPTLAWIYREPRVTPILRVLSLIFIISSIGLVHEALLRRKMLFDRLAKINISSVLLSVLVAILLAYLGWRVWALVASAIVQALVATSLLSLSSPWWSRWSFQWSEIKRVRNFIFNLTGFQVFNYFSRNADNFIIGRFLGAGSLGFYSMAYTFYMFPIQNISHAVGRVLFPSLTAVQDDDIAIGEKFLRACRGVTFITFPLMAGLCILAGPFVNTLYGSKWAPAVPLIMILSLVAVIQSPAVMVGHIFITKGKVEWWLRWGVISGLLIILSFICGLPWGVVGVASAYGIVMIPLTYFSFVIAFRFIKLGFSELIKTISPYAIATAVMAGFVVAARLIMENVGAGTGLVLGAGVGIGVITYTAFILVIRPPALGDFVKLLPGDNLRIMQKLWAWSQTKTVRS